MKQQFVLVTNQQNNQCSCNNFSQAVETNNNEFFFSNCTVEQNIETFCKVSKQSIKITNTSDKAIFINRLSSLFIDNIAPKFAQNDVVIHICHCMWQGEGQWTEFTPFQMGLYPSSAHKNEIFRRTISNKGSWSTCSYYPIVIIEDKSNNKVWFFEHVGSMSYEFEFGVRGIGNDAVLTVEVNVINDMHTGDTWKLESGESLETSSVLFGVIDGNKDSAIQYLIDYKRTLGKTNSEPIVCFNDYMNCLWALPSDKKLLPLIDVAAKVGADVFCIDDGWFLKTDYSNFGDWEQDDSKFGEYGFDGIIEYIKKKGMIPGIWLELETAMPESKLSKLAINSMLIRDGTQIEYGRGFVSFDSYEVCEYLRNVIKRLYDKGIRYIKNDYNHSLCSGCDLGDENKTKGLMQAQASFLRFINEVQTEFPDLIIENCGSGAMRCDFGILSHFKLQSISDQEIYTNNPSILQGMLGCITPEKCGVWCYPYPIPFENRNDDFNSYFSTEYLDDYDCEQTVYNMACGLFGVPYLSGHIEYADQENLDLIKMSVDIFKSEYRFIKTAYPISIYPQQHLFADGYTVLALKNNDKLRIGIFKNNANDSLEVDVSEYVSPNSKLKEVYPINIAGANTYLIKGKLTFYSEKKIIARVYEIQQ